MRLAVERFLDVRLPVPAPRERREQEQRREAAEAAGRGHRRGGAWAFWRVYCAALLSHCSLSQGFPTFQLNT